MSDVKPFDKQGLLDALEKAAESDDTEEAHGDADDALIDYINDKDISEAYHKIPKWYA